MNSLTSILAFAENIRRMWKIWLTVLFTMAIALGCASLSNPGTADKVAASLRIAAQSGVYYFTKGHPEYRPYFKAVADTLKEQVSAGVFDPNKLLSAIESVRGDVPAEAKLAVTGVISLYQLWLGDRVNAGIVDNPGLATVLLGVAQGISVASSDAPASPGVLVAASLYPGVGSKAFQENYRNYLAKYQ